MAVGVEDEALHLLAISVVVDDDHLGRPEGRAALVRERDYSYNPRLQGRGRGVEE